MVIVVFIYIECLTMPIKLIFCTLAFILLNSSCAREGNSYARIKENSFQLASKSFLPTKGTGPKITLLGVIHIGEERYYREIQAILNKADLVLFEGIGNQAERDEIKKNCPQMLKANINAQHKKSAKNLELVFQQKIIEHGGDKFVHADVTRMQLFDALKIAPNKPLCERLKVEEEQKEQPRDAKAPPADIARNSLAFALSKSLSHEKNEFTTEDDEAIIFYRNQVLMKKLGEYLPRYSSGQEIVILFGAGHMPDIEASLLNMDYSFSETKWFSAFGLLN